MNEVDEQEEREHLERVQAALAEALTLLDSRVKDYDAQQREHLKHMWEHRRDMDHAEKADFAVGDLIDHPKFGRGTVQAAAETSIEVEFADGTWRTLVHGRSR